MHKEVAQIMKLNHIPTPVGPTVPLAVQLFISHLIIGALMLVTVTRLPQAEPSILLLLAGVIGLLLTFNIQRSLRLISLTLLRLANALPVTALSTLSHWPLGRVVAQLNALSTRQLPTEELRENLLRQAGEAATQEERNRLARDLHDSIKQQIFSIQVSAAAVQARWEHDPDGAKTAVADVRQRAQEALVEMNALLQQLSPAPLEKVGLVQALRDQCEALGYRTGAEVVPEIGDLPDNDRLPVGAQETIFRIAQEALSNVARHARADKVHLRLRQNLDREALLLEIDDDGQGFDVKKATDGTGLTNIRHRVGTLDGVLNIESAPGLGTRLEIEIPLIKPVQVEEEIIYPKDYTVTTILFTGLITGLVLIAVLYYPLYIMLPGQFVVDWSDPVPVLTLLSQILATAATVIGGYFGARWTRPHTRLKAILLGAFTGGAAAATLFVGLAAAAAGLMGAAPILEHGLIPAGSEAELVQLTVEAVVGIVWWTYGALWILLLAGIGLGAVGGVLASLTDSRPVETLPKTLLSADGGAAIVFLLSSFLALAVSVAGMPLLEKTMLESIIKHQVVLPSQLPPHGVAGLPITTTAIAYLFTLGALTMWLHIKRQTADSMTLRRVSINAYSLAFMVTAGWLLLFPFIFPLQASSSWLAVGTLVISLPLAGIIFSIGLSAEHHRTDATGSLTKMWNVFKALLRWEKTLVGGLIGGIIVWIIALSLLMEADFLLWCFSPVILIAGVVFAGYRVKRGYSRLLPTGSDLKPFILGGRPPFSSWRDVAEAIITTIFASVIPVMAWVGVYVLNIILLAVKALPILRQYPGNQNLEEPLPQIDFTLTGMVQDLYLTHVQVVLWGVLITIILVGIGIIVVGIVHLIRRLQQKRPHNG